MPASVALALFAVGIIGLFALARDPNVRTSPGLWIPVIWLCIGASRNVTQWFDTQAAVDVADQFIDGSPTDRLIMSALIFMGLIVLMARGRATGQALLRNLPLVLFLTYCAASVFWSDFPFVAFKRWTKVAGNVVMVFIVLTELDPVSALKRLLTRTAFILIPASVMVVKYFPAWGRHYDRWEGTQFFSGVALDKNMLGCLCFIAGLTLLASLLDIVRTKGWGRQAAAMGVVLGMTVWLLQLARSSTSLACFLVGSMVILILSAKRARRLALVHVLAGGLAVFAVVAYFVQGFFAFLVSSLGRNTTLTGRTDLWLDLLSLNGDPWLGVGFESFFLGDRLTVLWSRHWWHPAEAHNGYLEIYLTLGIVGLWLLGLVILSGYRNVIKAYRLDPVAGSLRLAFLISALLYNITEAAFKVTHPVWIVFLLAVTAMMPATEPAVATQATAFPGGPSGRRQRGVLRPTPAPPVPARALGSRPLRAHR